MATKAGEDEDADAASDNLFLSSVFNLLALALLHIPQYSFQKLLHTIRTSHLGYLSIGGPHLHNV